MKKFVIPILSVCLCSLSAGVSAQNNVFVENETDDIVLIGFDKAGDEIIRIMKDTQLPHIHDPQAPRFVLTDRQGKYALGIGGYVRAVAEYDFGGIVADNDFVPADIANGGINNQIQMDASTANIFLKLVGQNELLGDFVVYTDANFRGSGKTFKLRNAYMSFRGVTIGYTYGGFMDAGAVPATVDFQGPNGAASYRVTQLAYTYKGLKNFQFNASVEMPEVEGVTDNNFQIEQQRMPNFTLYAQYNFGKNSHLRLAGLLRNMTYTNEAGNNPSDVTGYGVQASTTFRLTPQWKLYGQASYGKGIGQFLNDLSELDADLVPNPQKSNEMQALDMLGWFAGVQYNVCPNLFFTGCYSMARRYSDNGYAESNPEGYCYGQYAQAAMFWNVTSNMQLGAEYLHGWKTSFDNSTRNANRVSLQAKYSF